MTHCTYTLLLAATQVDALLADLGLLTVREHLEVGLEAARLNDLAESSAPYRKK